MSALECNRDGCGNAMCDRFSIDYGYICDECFTEMVLSDCHGGSISTFMQTTPNRRYLRERRAFYNEVFPLCRGDEQQQTPDEAG